MSEDVILTLNAGSSSIKFALFSASAVDRELARGQVDGIGAEASLSFRREDGTRDKKVLGRIGHSSALGAILHSETGAVSSELRIAAIGHRIVHGGTRFVDPVVLDSDTMAGLSELEPLAPLHQPHNLAAIRAAMAAFPDAMQVGCFDTAFHRSHGWLEDVYALPRAWHAEGVRRYGFHGLSYAYIAEELRQFAPELHAGKVIAAHLGNGTSMCAMAGGRSMASTMGFSALDGLPMGTRSGQIDPGVLLYMMTTKGMSAQAIADCLYKESGLRGLSGISNDLRTLEASDDPAAGEAIAYLAHRIRRETGSLAAVMGGVDAFVFTGGIGENSALVRSLSMVGMEWLGLAIDHDANDANHGEIGIGRVRILVIPTNEELMIARSCASMLAGSASRSSA